ncbi:unnamed protein product [Lactuca virosa]|uniref:Reverse transcriptase domain-containing protein n=1 Tax=Lactuca virosa TaxID=75947 RepID=A0AAU9NNN3_9ASTR|nr:unnamed protein product [Lactuca virosa]
MPFGLKNAGATYQRLIDKGFADQIGRNIEVYVDDMVIKSGNEEELLHDVKETFQIIAKAKMKLNPAKCTFGVEEGQFLGLQLHLFSLPPITFVTSDEYEAPVVALSDATSMSDVGESYEEWLQREDHVVYSRDFLKQPVTLAGGDQRSCDVGSKFFHTIKGVKLMLRLAPLTQMKHLVFLDQQSQVNTMLKMMLPLHEGGKAQSSNGQITNT